MNDSMTPAMLEKLGRRAYERYNESRGGKTWDGKPIPTWDALAGQPTGEGVREGWRCAADSIVEGLGEVFVEALFKALDEAASRAPDCGKVDPPAPEPSADAPDHAGNEFVGRAIVRGAIEAEHARCVGLVRCPIANLELRAPLEVQDMMVGRLTANPPLRA